MTRYYAWGKIGVSFLLMLFLVNWVNLEIRSESMVESSYFPQEKLDKRNHSWGRQSQLADREETLLHQAKSITVQVLSGNTSGSGILIHRNNNLYSVITNHHVLIFGEPTLNYRIKTPDGSIYPAKVISPPSLKNYDLGLLQFSTEQTYTTIQINPAVALTRGKTVYAAGFPAESNPNDPQALLLTKGKVEMFSQQSFSGGYQIGSSNLIKKGMSGGPLLSSQGELIGINGLHKYPLWGNPFTFEDGSTASSSNQKTNESVELGDTNFDSNSCGASTCF